MSPDQNEFEGLCHAVLEGAASDAQRGRLRELLHADAGLRAEFQTQLRLHALLSWQHGRGTDVPAEPVMKSVPQKVTRWRAWRPALAAAAAVVLLAAGWVLQSFRSGVALEILTADSVPFAAGQRVSLHRLKLDSGAMKFRLESGALVEVDGPADIELLSAMHLRVFNGNVTTDVGDKARGFVIETANARVVDLGTRFGVAVGQAGDTDVVVFEGKVDVFDPARKSSGQPPLASLTEGDAVRMNTARIPERIGSVPVRADSRAVAAQSGPRIVTAVTDNLIEKGFNRYYGVAAGAMQDNARSYTTMTRARWHAVAGAEFPEELRGADVVATFHDDRHDRDLHIRLEVGAPCSVYVLLDVRGPVPDWVQAGYRDTGIRLRSGPWNPVAIVRDVAPDSNGHLYVTCAVWRKDVPAAGIVELGPPYAQGQPANRAMYGIAVQALK